MQYKIAICICTFKRPMQLSRLLESLVILSRRTEFSVIIIDNDKNGSAREVYTNFKGKLKLIYDVEENQGLSNARNRCIDKASELNVDYIAFLDDDEIVEREDWFINLINAASKYNSEIITGPVLPLYHPEIKGYIKKSGFFSSIRFKDGTKLPHTGTGNTLIKLSILSDINPVFCNEFNFSGGEDTHLFSKLVNQGNTITWCNDAEIYEYIPLERGNISYIFKRSFCSSSIYIKVNSKWSENPKVNKKIKLSRFCIGALKIITGLGVIIISPIIGMYKFVQGISLIGKGLGDIAGVFGVNSILYK